MRSGLGVPMLCLLGAVVWTIGNLPLFTAVVLAVAVAGRHDVALDVLAVAYLAARIGQSIVHALPGAGIRFHVRFGFFVAQLVCLVAFVVVLVPSAP